MNLNLENLPETESLNAFWDGEEGTVLRNTIFRVTNVRKYFRTFQAFGATDIDGPTMVGTGASMFFICLRTLTRSYISSQSTSSFFSYVMGEFLPLFLPELAGGLLFSFLKKDGGQSDSVVQLGSPATVRV